VIWIAPRDELATREKLALESQSQINELEQTRTEAFQMNYQKAADVQKLLSTRRSACCPSAAARWWTRAPTRCSCRTRRRGSRKCAS
jgi:Tfp pilus assembly protein FimT